MTRFNKPHLGVLQVNAPGDSSDYEDRAFQERPVDGLREFEPFLCATQRSHEFTISADYRHSFSTLSDISQPRVDWIRRRAMLLHRWTLGSLPSSILDAVYAHDLSGLRTLLRDRQPARNRETLLGFQQAVGDNLADVVEVFLEEGIDLNGVEATGFTALISAVRGGQVPMVNRLLVAGADVNVPDAHGATPLHYASMRQSLDLVQLLVEAGADPNCRDYQGNTPLDLAYRREVQLPAALPLIGDSILTYRTRKDTPLVAYLRELPPPSANSGRDHIK